MSPCPAKSRVWRTAFLGLFVPLALPPLTLYLVPLKAMPEWAGALLWLWFDCFAPDSFSKLPPAVWPLASALSYTVLAVAFAFACEKVSTLYLRAEKCR